jgi:death-on-curing protein
VIEVLGLDEVLESHAEQIALYGGADGIRDIGLLESALAQPAGMFAGEYLHIDVFEMAAAYLFHIVKNHPFVDGNKRTGLLAALLFLETNGYTVEIADELLVDLVSHTIQNRLTKPQIAEFFRNHVA